MKPLSMKKFARVVSRVMETLPPELKQHLDNVTVDIEEVPDVETLRQAGFTEEEIEAGDCLYGLFAPMDLPTHWSADAVHLDELPHRITIYKCPLEEDFTDQRQLMIEIRKTIIHELAHHFGYTDRDLERFDSKPNPFSKEEEE